MAITPYYLSLIDLDNPFDPVRLQAVPTAKELHRSDADLLDPLHEDTDSPCPVSRTVIPTACSCWSPTMLHVLPSLHAPSLCGTKGLRGSDKQN